MFEDPIPTLLIFCDAPLSCLPPSAGSAPQPPGQVPYKRIPWGSALDLIASCPHSSQGALSKHKCDSVTLLLPSLCRCCPLCLEHPLFNPQSQPPSPLLHAGELSSLCKSWLSYHLRQEAFFDFSWLACFISSHSILFLLLL